MQTNTAQQTHTNFVMKLSHSPDCSTIFLRSVYDRACPRCSKIANVIQLKRKTVANGASFQEAQSALAMATRLAERYQLVGAELVDRLYTSPTNKFVRKRRTKIDRSPKDCDMMEGME